MSTTIIQCEPCCSEMPPKPIPCPCPNYEVKTTLTVTVVAPINWPCAHGLSFTLHYWMNEGPLLFYRTQGPRNYNIALIDLPQYYGSFGAYNVIQCEPLMYDGIPGQNCRWHPTDQACYTDFDFGFIFLINTYDCSTKIISYIGTGNNYYPYCASAPNATILAMTFGWQNHGKICVEPLFLNHVFNNWSNLCPPGQQNQGLCECINLGSPPGVNLNATGIGTLEYVVTE